MKLKKSAILILLALIIAILLILSTNYVSTLKNTNVVKNKYDEEMQEVSKNNIEANENNQQESNEETVDIYVSLMSVITYNKYQILINIESSRKILSIMYLNENDEEVTITPIKDRKTLALDMLYNTDKENNLTIKTDDGKTYIKEITVEGIELAVTGQLNNLSTNISSITEADTNISISYNKGIKSARLMLNDTVITENDTGKIELSMNLSTKMKLNQEYILEVVLRSGQKCYKKVTAYVVSIPDKYIGTENETVTLDPTASWLIKYGINGRNSPYCWARNSIYLSNSVFGDPLYGTVKNGYIIGKAYVSVEDL